MPGTSLKASPMEPMRSSEQSWGIGISTSYHPQFSEAEAQRGQEAYPRSHSQEVEKLQFHALSLGDTSPSSLPLLPTPHSSHSA